MSALVAYAVIATVVLLGGTALYLLLVPDVANERFGAHEAPLVRDWRVDMDSPEGEAARMRGLLRETRTFLQEARGLFGGQRLLKQVRYRSATTGTIVSVEPDKALKRGQRS